ncbi:hypothetical protein VISI1226_13461 [Vibrio sinaloensis DSM 21326]|uniref:Competence protein n=1 Tax=Vibrio sinaloensis DSM 21326 TaxID=945550 RepID=E8M6T8_PHOS4|nr:hypothetical protein [Vibrio sinaloensis]EGA70242.1 hypothetical protein VISI1226_13461 [Vibrio sinaloensis DSM 21326]
MSHLEKNISAYGLMNDQLVHIDQVESGLACKCSCIGCGDKLVAKKGELKQHHFAHHAMDSNECSESALHKICKHIVENEKRILSPELTVSCHQFDLAGIEHAKHETLAAELLMFNEVLLEQTEGDFIPDVTGVFDHQQRVFIEIVVTNDVSEEKLEKVKRLGVPMMAIYVSELDLMEPLESLTASVIEQAPRKWIYHPIIEQLETRLRNELEFEISIINERMRLAVLEEQETSNQSTPIVLKQNQMLLLGYNSAHGYSRKKARNFDFSMLHVTNPIRSSSTVNYTVRANGGYEVKSIYFDEALLPQLAAMTFPCVVELGIKAAFISGRPATLVDSITTV